MIALLLSTLLSLFLCTSFGFYFTKLIKIPSNFSEKLLIGLVICNTISSYVSLFFPINVFVLLILIGISLFVFIIIIKEFNPYFLSLHGNRYLVLYILAFLSVAYIISIDSPKNYDTGLYHLQSIKWIEEYSVIPGLANLHGRFGFNPNIFTFFALTSIHDLFNQEIFSVNFAVLTILVIYFICKLYSLIKQKSIDNIFIFYLFLFLFVLRLPYLSSPSPDFLSSAICLFVFARIFDLSSKKANSELKSYFPILILSIYLLTVKLSSLPVLLLFVFVFIKYKFEIRKSFWLLPLLGLIILPWLIRNIIMTGWLIYPFPSIDLFSFDWKVPIGRVISEKMAVTGWARNPGVNYVDAANMILVDWFPIWWERLDFYHRIFFVMSIVFPLFASIGQLIKKLKIDLFTNAVITTSFFGVVFWLFLAPDWRFGEPFILIASMSPLLFINSYSQFTINIKRFFSVNLFFLFGYFTLGKFIFALSLILFLLLFLKSCLNKKYNYNFFFGAIISICLLNYTRNNYSLIKTNSYLVLNSFSFIKPPKIEIPKNLNFKTYNTSGVDVYVPSEGDQCFDHKIPCTTYPDTTLILRMNKLKSGFRHTVRNKL